MIKKSVRLLIIFIFLAILYSLGRQIYNTFQSAKRIDMAVEELSKLQQKNTELKKKLAEAQTIGFMEKIARDKLNMSRDNETVMVIAQSQIDNILNAGKKVEEIKLPNWQGWLRLFFK